MPLKNRLDAWSIVKTVTVWMAILYIICAAAFLILPQTTFDVLWKPMIHAFNLKPIGINMVIGFIEAVVYTALSVWLLVVLYNYFTRNKA